MSTSKIVRSKRKALIPSEISMSVNTPKSRKFLFPSEPVSGNTRESEKEDETTGIKKSKKKKIRKTQNFLEFLDETDAEVHARGSVSPKRSKMTLFVESGDTESSEVSAEQPKSVTKSKKKKIKFPEVVLDDLEVFDNSDKCSLSDKRKKLKRQQSIDSNSSSTLEVIKTDKAPKRTRKSRKSKETENEENAKSVKTRSAKKLNNQEIPDETINTANKSRKSADNLVSINKTSQSTDSEQSGVNNEVTLTNCASSVDEDKAETNTQSSGKKKKKRSKKLSKENFDPSDTVIKTRSSRKRHRETFDNDEGTVNEKGTQIDSEKTEEGNENLEVDENSATSTVTENDGIEVQSKKRKKRSKKSDPKHNEDTTLTQITRNSRRRTDRKSNNDNGEDLDTLIDIRTNGDLEKNSLEDVAPTNSSVDEEESNLQSSSKKTKKKKKSKNNYEEDETIKTKRQSLRNQNDSTIENEKENSELKSNDWINSEENGLTEDVPPTNSSVDENEAEVQISAKKRKNKKKSNNKHVEDETINTKRQSLRHQNDRTIEDEKENSELKTNNTMDSEENVLNDDFLPTNTSGDENEEVQISAKKIKNKKKSNNKHVEDETLYSKRQSLRRQSNMKIKDEQENVQFDNELNYQTRNSNTKKTNEYILSSVEDILLEVRNCSSVNQETEVQTSTRKRKRSRISDYKQDPDKTLTSKINSESEENKESGNNSIDQIEDSKESTMNKNNYLMPVNENIHFNRLHSGSVDADDEMEYPTSAKKKKRSTRSSRKQDETFTETQTSRKSKDMSKEKESYEKELENELTDSLEYSLYISASGKEEIKVPVEESCSPVDDDDVVQDTSAKERNISKRTTLDCNQENQELSKYESSENKENLKSENQSMVESSRSSRRSRRTFSFGPTEDETGEGELKNDINSFADQGLNLIDRPEGFPSITDRNSLQPDVPVRKSSTGRKRWTKAPEKVELFLPQSNETSNASSSVNPSSQRRSVRKRWSSELKKKFESMRKDNDSLFPNNGVSEEYSFATEGQNRNDISQSSSNISSDSPILMKRIDYLDSPMSVYAPSAFDSINEKLDETFTPEKSEQDSFTRRSSKRLSRSLDLSEGVSVLEQTVTVENEASKFSNYNPECSFKRMSNKSPASILKRRDTYDLDQSITDVSVLRSLSENNLSDPGLVFKQDDCESVKKNVRFQHVTVRRGAVRKDDPHTPENKVEPNNLLVTTDKKSALKSGAANKSVSFDQTMFSTSSLASSTPLHSLRKNTLMKQTMRREKLSNVANINRRSRSVETKRDKYVNRIRMPNFTKIHQKAMERVEDISEMAKRKAERARLLLSGQKPTANTGSAYKTQEKNIIHAKQPKQLKFTKSQQVTNHPTKETTSTAVTNKISKVAVQAKVDNSKTKDAKTLPGVVSKFTNPLKKKETAPSKLLVGRSVIADKLQTLKTNPSQFGALKRAEQIKTIVTKSKPTKVDDREERRIVVKGVRGNRRFDLLLQMRNK